MTSRESAILWRHGRPRSRKLLDALVALRQLRARLDQWEPRLIAAARQAGVSWTRLAPALGVASRQAAERRFLRLHQPDPGGAEAGSRDQCVQAVRDRRPLTARCASGPGTTVPTCASWPVRSPG